LGFLAAILVAVLTVLAVRHWDFPSGLPLSR
jgi:hypothetical protein